VIPSSLQRQIRLKALPPLALYVHIPWCVRKCPYCDFNSHELRESLPEQAYVAALVADLEMALPQIWGRSRLHRVLRRRHPERVLARCDRHDHRCRASALRLVPDAEITLEANPGTVDAERFAGFRAAGINRLSLGVQSFDAANLRALGRIHDDRLARDAVEAARRSFDNVNIDLMYALPQQSVSGALADVEAAIAFSPTHISAYHLTLEPNTLFHRSPPPLPDDDTCAQMQEEIEARLGDAGFENYETSAFALTGRRCAHNLNYWRFGDYLGIGAGAHSKLSFPDRVRREMRSKHPKQYLAKAGDPEGLQEAHDVALADLPFEFMMNALRLTQGFPLAMFEERTGLSLSAILNPLDAAERDGLIERDHVQVRPTLRGRRFLNELLQRFLPEPDQASTRR
jgi:putative oxygen-independent coproporphyrinogen III oxidase